MEIPEGLDLTFEVRSKNFLEEKSKKQKKYRGSLLPTLPTSQSTPWWESQTPCKYRNLLKDQNIFNSLSARAEPQLLIPPRQAGRWSYPDSRQHGDSLWVMFHHAWLKMLHNLHNQCLGFLSIEHFPLKIRISPQDRRSGFWHRVEFFFILLLIL